MLGSATADSFHVALPMVLADPGIDAVIVLFVPPVAVEAADVGAAISRATAAANQPDKPVLAAILAANGAPATLRSAAQIPSFAYPEAAAAALGRAAAYGEWLRRSAGTVPRLDDVDTAAAAEVVAAALADDDRGVARPGCHAEAAAGLRAAARRRAPRGHAGGGGKRRRPSSATPSSSRRPRAGAHKTESGGVVLDLADAEAVRAAAERIGGPVIVQPHDHEAASSCSRASRRTRCSGRSSPSARAA